MALLLLEIPLGACSPAEGPQQHAEGVGYPVEDHVAEEARRADHPAVAAVGRPRLQGKKLLGLPGKRISAHFENVRELSKLSNNGLVETRSWLLKFSTLNSNPDTMIAISTDDMTTNWFKKLRWLPYKDSAEIMIKGTHSTIFFF